MYVIRVFISLFVFDRLIAFECDATLMMRNIDYLLTLCVLISILPRLPVAAVSSVFLRSFLSSTLLDFQHRVTARGQRGRTRKIRKYREVSGPREREKLVACGSRSY